MNKQLYYNARIFSPVDEEIPYQADEHSVTEAVAGIFVKAGQ